MGRVAEPVDPHLGCREHGEQPWMELRAVSLRMSQEWKVAVG